MGAPNTNDPAETNENQASITQPEIVADPVITEEVPAEIPEPIVVAEPVPTSEAYDKQDPAPNPELYTIQAADLNAYPELSQQGAQLYDQIPYASLYVWKKATADGESVVQQAWPLETGNEKIKAITFNG